MKILIVLIFIVAFFSFSVSASPKIIEDDLKNCAAFLDAKNFTQAIDACTKAVETDPKDFRIYYYRGTAYINLKTSDGYEKAQADFKKCVQLNPKFDDGQYLLGFVIVIFDEKEIAEYELAIKSFTEAIKFNNDRKDIYYQRGEAYRKAADKLTNFLYNDDWKKPESKVKAKNYFESAVADYQKSLEINPSLEAALLKSGMAQMALEQYETAIMTLNKYITNKPNDKRAYENRCYSYFGLKKYQLALTDCDKALELNRLSSESETKKESFADIVKLVQAEIVKENRKSAVPTKKPVGLKKKS